MRIAKRDVQDVGLDLRSALQYGERVSTGVMSFVNTVMNIAENCLTS